VIKIILKSKIEIQLKILSYFEFIDLIDKLFFSKDLREDIDCTILDIFDFSLIDISILAYSLLFHLKTF
jgi:hypothetical protein